MSFQLQLPPNGQSESDLGQRRPTRRPDIPALALIKDATDALDDKTATADERISRAQALLRRWMLAPPVNLLTLIPRTGSQPLFRAANREETADHGATSVPVTANPLSPRESAVLRLICRGFSNKVIARSLAIAPETVKSHAKNILKKLNAQTRAEAVALAARFSLLV